MKLLSCLGQAKLIMMHTTTATAAGARFPKFVLFPASTYHELWKAMGTSVEEI